MIAESLNQKECLNCKSDLAALGKTGKLCIVVFNVRTLTAG